MSKVTFHGLPAWVGAIHSPTACDWWHSDPAQLKWDRNLMHTVDLAMTPSAVTAGRIQVSQVEVDDFTGSGGRTTIGPLWPGGATIGACWVSDPYFARLGKPLPGVPAGGGGHDYEYMAVQYFDGEQGNRRFYGFHAHLVQTQHQLALVDVWNPGTGAGTGKPAWRWWLDLAADADPSIPALAAGRPGPLLLDTSKLTHVALIEPKMPPYKGGFALSR